MLIVVFDWAKKNHRKWQQLISLVCLRVKSAFASSHFFLLHKSSGLKPAKAQGTQCSQAQGGVVGVSAEPGSELDDLCGSLLIQDVP